MQRNERAVQFMKALAVAMIALISTICAAGKLNAQSPSWLSSAVIYCVDPEIFSTSGLAGVTAQLPRLQSLGVNVIWIMPIYPRGKAITIGGASRPSFNSPYCINNMEGIDPAMGTSTDMTNLVTAAHGRGMKVILDVAINATSWDNPLVTSSPQYYLHSDGNVNNVNSIEIGWGMDNDIAQFDLSQNTYGAQTYVRNVCKYWLSTYNLDGFRFDTADDPSGPTRSLPQSLAQSIQSDLQAINPNVLMLGEEYNQQIALAPYGLDYDIWVLQPAIKQACTSGNSAAGIQSQWQSQTTGWPSGMVHMSIMQDWDTDEDLNMYGGTAQTMDAAVENYTINGVPMLFCGEEVANTTSGLNTHNQINWSGSNATAFINFYTSLINLRDANPALQQGSMVWETNSASSAVTTLNRVSGTSNFYIEVNFSGSTQTGTLTAPSGISWTDVSPTGSPGGTSHQLPSTGSFNLKPYDFAIFQSGGTPTASTPTFSPAPGTYYGSQSVTLADSTSGATIYYTTNGTTPTTASTKYTGAITVSSSETIEAMAAASGYNNSNVASGAYTINSGVGGAVAGTVTPVTTAQAFNLTTIGTNDWAAWGYNSNDRDSSGGSKIGTVSVYGGGSLTSFTSSFLGLTWTNGTPDTAVTNETNGYYNAGGIGDGFSFTAPASTTSQTLTVFVGGWSTGGTFTATLSDGSAVPYTDSSQSNSGNSYFAYYAITYHAASAGQTLTILWKEVSGTGNVTIYGAALGGAVMPTAATPTFSPAPGTYTGTQSATLSDTTSGSTIYYTTNGTTPTTSSTQYTGAIGVSSTETIQAIAAASGYNNSSVASGTYTINLPTAATPTFSPAPGTYTSAQSVTLSDTTTGANIYYTTDGSTPTTSSTHYTAAISVTATETIKAIAAASGYNNSSVASGAYTINTGSGGSLTGTPTPVNSAQAFNLTTQGTADWAAWGYNSNDRDSSGGSKIGSVSTFGGGSLNAFTSSFMGFTWTNGTPDTSVTNETNGYFNNGGVGDGFTFTAPASTTSQTLVVYVGGWTTGGTLTATLSDGSAAAYTDSSQSNSGNSYYAYYTLTYKAASAGQTISVVWKEASGTGNVTIYAAALEGASLPTAATPTFSPAPGTYTSAQSVTLSDTTSGSSIYYTTNGTTPTTSSTLYTGAISVSSTETIQAIAAVTGYNNSSVGSGAYTINLPTAATPTFSPAPGTYTTSQSVTLSDTTTGANIYYTTDGTTPTTSSTHYTGAISITATTTIKAIAAASGYSNSSVVSGTYTINSSTGSLSGTVTAVTSAQAFNLTTLGTTDWAAWGFNGYDHDTSGGSQVSNVSTFGGGSLNAFTSSFMGFTWTNGTPDASETNETKGYYNAGGVGDGFTFTVPASTTLQHLTVYVGGWTTGGTLTATLSDGSAAAYTDSSQSNSGNSYYAYYTLTYNAASVGKTLTVVWKQASGTGNVTIYAAALH